MTKSLSSWRAWIEISACEQDLRTGARRSPHGERGLKFRDCQTAAERDTSLSSWRAWIEITMTLLIVTPAWSRSPHGERGLKSDPHAATPKLRAVALLMESVD